MKHLLTLCILMIALPALAGTFRDDFDDGNIDGWDIQTQGGQIEVVDGEVVIIDADPGLASLMFFNDSQYVRDFELSVDGLFVRKLSNKTWDYMVVMSRAGDLGSAWVSFQAEGNIPLVILTAPPALDAFGRRDVPFPLEFGKWYHIQLEVRGSVLSLTVDDEFVSEIDWSAQPMLSKEGAVAIGAGGAEVHFDNFSITGSGIPDTVPSGSAVDSIDKLTTTWGQMRGME